MEENLIMEIWDLFNEYVSEKNKEIAANQYVDFLLGQGFEVDTLEGLMGYDPYMDAAIKIVVDDANDGLTDDEDEEHFDAYDDEDEDS